MNPTEKHLGALAKATAQIGEDSCLTTIGGVLITVHAGRYETAVGHDRWVGLNRNPRPRMGKRPWLKN
jgi:hypothetical protein